MSKYNRPCYGCGAEIRGTGICPECRKLLVHDGHFIDKLAESHGDERNERERRIERYEALAAEGRPLFDGVTHDGRTDTQGRCGARARPDARSGGPGPEHQPINAGPLDQAGETSLQAGWQGGNLQPAGSERVAGE